MSVFITLVTFNIRFYFSTKRFQILFPFFIIVLVVFPLLEITGIAPRSPDIYTYTQSGFVNYSFLAVLVSGMLAGDALSQDFRRQGLFILSQPIRRSTILLSRFVAAFLASCLILVLLYETLGPGFAYYMYGELVPNTWLIPPMSLLFVAATVAFVMFVSSAIRNSNASITVSILSVWVIMPLISSVAGAVRFEPWFLLTYAGNVLQALAQKTYPSSVQSIPFGGLGSGLPSVVVYNPGFWESTEIMLAYTCVSLLLAWFIYSRKEMKGAL
jgi:ABC-type transport system involved in multi-copper enzyme maturation permease subunit